MAAVPPQMSTELIYSHQLTVTNNHFFQLDSLQVDWLIVDKGAMDWDRDVSLIQGSADLY